MLKDFEYFGSPCPIIGDLHRMLGSKRGLYERGMGLARSIGVLDSQRPVRFWMGELPYIMVFKAEDLEVLLGSARPIFKPDLVYKPVKSFFGAGLITLNGEQWLHHRKVLTPVFHFKILERYVEVFKRRAEDLAKELLEPRYRGLEVDALPITTRLVSNTICETAFGMSELLTEKDEIKKKDAFFAALEVAFKIIEKRIMKPWLMVDALFRLSSLYTKQRQAEDIINEYALRIIKMKKDEIASEAGNEITSPDDDSGVKKKVAFLDLVLRDKTNLLSDEEILQEVRTLVTVQQTTASTMSFIFVMLAIYQDVQDEVFREIQALDQQDTFRSYHEKLSEMKYLERVIKETLRLYPITALFSRDIKEDLELQTCTLPAGVFCSVFLPITHRDKRYFGPDPERFDPDHFLPERCRTRHPYAYVPFSAGPRNCIGQKYAMLQMKAVVSSVIRQLRVFPGKGCHSQEEMHVDIDTFLHIVGGFNVRFEPRVV